MNSDLTAGLEKAKYLSSNGQKQEAKAILLSLNDAYPSNLRILHGLGAVCSDLGDYEEALLYFQCHNSINDKNAKVYMKMADVLSKSNQCEEATQNFKISLSIDPINAQCLFKFAQHHQSSSNFQSARDLYQEAMRIDPNIPCIYYHFGCLLMEHFNDPKTAISALSKAIALKPEDSRYQQQYELCADAMKDIEHQEQSRYLLDESDVDKVKVIIFNFDSMLLIHPLRDQFTSSPHRLPKLYEFGGIDRVGRINVLFSGLTSKGIDLVLRSDAHPHRILDALANTDWARYFTRNSIINRNEEINNIFPDYKAMEIVNVDHVICQFCKSIIVNHHEELPAIKLIDIEAIELLFGTEEPHQQRIYSSSTFPYAVPKSLITENRELYNNIKVDVDMSRYRSHSPEVCKWQCPYCCFCCFCTSSFECVHCVGVKPMII